MTQYPNEKPNNPYIDSVQPSDQMTSHPQQQQQQTQYQAPSGPPPAYTLESPYTQRDGMYQGSNPQSQLYQSQTRQVPPSPSASPEQNGGQYPSNQQEIPGARYPYDQDRAGPSYTSYQPSNHLSPYSQTPGAMAMTTPQDRSPSPSNGLSLASFFGNTGPPPMWQRQPAVHLPYSQFPPMCLISNSKDLSKGFPEVPPPCQVQPHPFATHDIAEEDWKRFLADVKKAGSLTGGQRIKSNVIPMVTGVGLIGGFFFTSAIKKKMKAKNRGAAGDAVDNWNHNGSGPLSSGGAFERS
ncbi:hypothetical protein AZE42_08204 [Rhizopogon vesiculosus]|uniref:Uncharacterized protein n=1 Tax=Rhizopogon vesiculosus TaxID=180088 RepID=A0A1J8PU76_9AGAM|nr:hypothetical protein AZE42_08204 [Rhizopogon vesiculosus]